MDNSSFKAFAVQRQLGFSAADFDVFYLTLAMLSYVFLALLGVRLLNFSFKIHISTQGVGL